MYVTSYIFAIQCLESSKFIIKYVFLMQWNVFNLMVKSYFTICPNEFTSQIAHFPCPFFWKIPIINQLWKHFFPHSLIYSLNKTRASFFEHLGKDTFAIRVPRKTTKQKYYKGLFYIFMIIVDWYMTITRMIPC